MKRLAPLVPLLCAALLSVGAQGRTSLLMTPADSLLDQGRWSEAEALFYQQSERAPRNPVYRAALGRYISMKGAVRPGIVLIEEARVFGLDTATARALLVPLRAILRWRSSASQLRHDSTSAIRASTNSEALFQIPFPRIDTAVHATVARGSREMVWHDVVDREIGLDSLNAPEKPIGIEVFEAFSPAVNVRDNTITLHSNPGDALAAAGRRYQVLRSPRGVRVLMADNHIAPLAVALHELAPVWWQLDLPHGFLLVR